MGSAFAHKDVVGNSVVCSLVCSRVCHSLLVVDHGLKIGCPGASSSPMAQPFAYEAFGRLFASLASMRVSILVVAILLLVGEDLVQIFEALLAQFARVSRESFEGRLEVPSTSMTIIGF